jgi:ubiquinol-cytochrome c reductase iron-sulfur subunit
LWGVGRSFLHGYRKFPFMSADGPNGRPDLKRRAFLTRLAVATGGVAIAGTAWPFIDSLEPSARALAGGAPVDFDLSAMQEGELVTVQWRKKPIWILHRTQQQLQTLGKVASALSDPLSQEPQQPADMKLHLKNGLRAVEPQYCVLAGVCTHLGCTPEYRPTAGSVGPDWLGGFFCPCHGSRYDLSGRVFNGSPAPLNLPVPPYYFKTGHVITIGEVRGGGDQGWQPSIW